MVVLSTKKRYKWSKRVYESFVHQHQKFPKKPKLQETTPDWAKRLFIQVSLTSNRVESGEIFQAPKLLFPIAVLPYLTLPLI